MRRLTAKERAAIIETVNRREKIAVSSESPGPCQLCVTFGGSPNWRQANCNNCPVPVVFGGQKTEDSAPCAALLGNYDLAATAAAMLAAVLGVRVPKSQKRSKK